MSVYVGHREAVMALRRRLPPVTLLTGPSSVGKWTLAHHLADYHRVAAVDRVSYPNGLNAEAARAAVTFVTTGAFGAVKLVMARLDATNDTALNIMLKTLEEPPATARFIFTASRPVLPTIVSRAQQYRLGLLGLDELRTILTAHGMSPAVAGRAAPLGRGQVRAAMNAVSSTEGSKAVVLGVVRALATGDTEQYDRAFRGFDDDARDLFHVWLRETATGQWAYFTEADTFGLYQQRQRVRSMLFALSLLSRTGSRLGVRAALEPFLTPD